MTLHDYSIPAPKPTRPHLPRWLVIAHSVGLIVALYAMAIA